MTRAAVVLLAFGLFPAGVEAQFPAELAGRVVDFATSQPVAGALVEAGSARAFSDGSGSFTLRVSGAGEVEVAISHPSYATLRVSRRLESGRTSVEVFSLDPLPLTIEAITVTAAAREPGFLITRDDIERSGARTLGELLDGVPGVIVRESSNGGARVSIRGSAADQVLVLVDGSPVNDPLTGEADADAISLQGARSVRVLAGAQSARHGPRAVAGVVVVETSDAHEPFALASFEAGSLGLLALDAQVGTRADALSASAGARYRDVDGEFEYDRPAALGGGTASRLNGDERELGGFASVALPLHGQLRLRADVARVERGLPGPMHAPTPEARQDVVRGDARVTWDLSTQLATLRALASAGWHRLRYDDPVPAFGSAYHDTTHVHEAALRFEAERSRGSRVIRTLVIGAEMRRVALESTSLAPARVGRTDPSLFASGAVELPSNTLAPRLSLAARADRWESDWIISHDVALSMTAHRLTASVAHRSAFSPPAATDQFFAAGFAIAPNPALQPERIRSEIELTLTAAFHPGDVPLELGASAFRSDIDGMIVWAPDFRFVWSPRNRDVKRSGGEAWLRVRPMRDVELGAWGALARVTYDWVGSADTVQVVYRPRHSAGASAEWTPGEWRLSADGVYTGVRYATPGHANPLPGYWDVGGAVARSFQRGPFDVDAALRVDRLLDNTDSFVHGYAEPGRRLSIEMRVRAAQREPPVTITRRIP